MRSLTFFWSLVLLLNICLLSGEAQQLAPDDPVSPGTVPRLSAPPVDVYVLGPNDVVHIRVYQEDDLEARARIGKDGSIIFPLLGSVNIGGRTLEQAAAIIRHLLAADYLVNPQVSVEVAEHARRRFHVIGQVNRPGPYEIPFGGSVALEEAIAMAGGYTRLGAPWKITVERTVDGKKAIIKLDAQRIAKDKNAKPFEILPDDIINVGEKWI